VSGEIEARYIATHVEHCDSDALVPEVHSQQLANHVRGSFTSMMTMRATTLLTSTQSDGPAFATNDDEF
jgi:hypothetical protein